MTPTLQRATSTGGSLGEPVDVLVTGSGSVGQTHVQYRFIDNPVLLDVLPAWDSTLASISAINATLDRAIAILNEHTSLFRVNIDALAGRVVTWLAPSPAVPDMLPAAEAVTYISNSLGLPIQSVLSAAAIAPRTYYAWRETSGRQPRLGSQGALWKLVQTTEDLRVLLGDQLRGWITADPARRELFEAGQVDQLLASVLVERAQLGNQMSSLGPSSAAGVEVEVPSTRRQGRRLTAKPVRRAQIPAREAVED